MRWLIPTMTHMAQVIPMTIDMRNALNSMGHASQGLGRRQMSRRHVLGWSVAALAAQRSTA